MTIHPIGELCLVNEIMLEDSVELQQGDMVQFGKHHLFRFNHSSIDSNQVALATANVANTIREDVAQSSETDVLTRTSSEAKAHTRAEKRRLRLAAQRCSINANLPRDVAEL